MPPSRYKKIILLLVGLLVIGAFIYLIIVTYKESQPPLVSPPSSERTSPFGIKISGPAISEYSKTRPALPSNKEALKQRLVAPLGEAGVLLETSDFRIDYLSPDIFQVEIKTTSIASAKDNAVDWFKKKGFSEEDICKLPVTFYLSGEVVAKFKDSGLVFKPLPDFCE